MANSDSVTRRRVLQIAGAAAIATTPLGRGFAAEVGAILPHGQATLAKAEPYVQPGMNWSAAELGDFLSELPSPALLSLKKALEIVDRRSGEEALKGSKKDVGEIQLGLLRVSSNILTYPFRDENKIAYHELVKWVANDAGVDQWILDTQPTFVIERAFQERLFVLIWDKLDPTKRQELLSKLEELRPRNAGRIADKAAIAALSGSGALAALATTVYFAGFTFYTTMSVVICTVAGWFHVTLPFAVYTTATSMVAFLSGPIGLAILAVAEALVIAAYVGRADTKKTGAAICQIHALKVAALLEAGKSSDDLFRASGNPLKRQLVGKWKWQTSDGWIAFDLKSDGSFIADDHPDTRPQLNQGYGFVNRGKGNWTARDGELTIEMTHASLKLFWKEHPWTMIFQDEVTKVTPTEVILESGNRLTRE